MITFYLVIMILNGVMIILELITFYYVDGIVFIGLLMEVLVYYYFYCYCHCIVDNRCFYSDHFINKKCYYYCFCCFYYYFYCSIMNYFDYFYWFYHEYIYDYEWYHDYEYIYDYFYYIYLINLIIDNHFNNILFVIYLLMVIFNIHKHIYY